MTKSLKKMLSIVLALALVFALCMPQTQAQAAKKKKTKVTLDQKSITLEVGKTQKLVAKYGKKKITTNKKATWKSKNKKVATVKKGKIKAVGKGTTKITVKYSGKSATCTVTVTEKGGNGGGGDKKPGDDDNKPSNPTKSDVSLSMTPADGVIRDQGTSITIKAVPQKWGSGVPSYQWYKDGVAIPGATANTYEASAAGNYSCEVKYPEYTLKSGTVTVTSAVPADDFNFAKDCVVTYGEKNVYIEFDIKDCADDEGKTKEQEIADLRALGFTIDEEKGTASKTTLCATATYTFPNNNLPNTLSEIQQIPLDGGGGPGTGHGFGCVAGTICALATTDTEKYNMQNGDKNPLNKILDYLNGPEVKGNGYLLNTFDNFDIGDYHSHGIHNLKGKQNVFFAGATTGNGYTPTKPLSFTLYEGPYMIKGKKEVAGYNSPDRYMILLAFGGDDSQRYIDVYYSNKEQKWFSWDEQWKHFTSTFKEPDEQW